MQQERMPESGVRSSVSSKTTVVAIFIVICSVELYIYLQCSVANSVISWLIKIANKDFVQKCLKLEN